jgi:hypothetical protein
MGNSLEHTPEEFQSGLLSLFYVIEFNNWHWFGSVVWTENKIKMFLFSQKNIIVLIKSDICPHIFLKAFFKTTGAKLLLHLKC